MGAKSTGRRYVTQLDAAANNSLTMPLTQPSAGQQLVIDSIDVAFDGTTQTKAVATCRQSVGPVNLWKGIVDGNIAGQGHLHVEFGPFGFPCGADKAMELFVLALANCAIYATVVYHEETP